MNEHTFFTERKNLERSVTSSDSYIIDGYSSVKRFFESNPQKKKYAPISRQADVSQEIAYLAIFCTGLLFLGKQDDDELDRLDP